MIAIRLNPCIIFSKAGLHLGTDGIPLSRLAAAEVYEEDVCVPHHGCAGPYFVHRLFFGDECAGASPQDSLSARRSLAPIRIYLLIYS
jgi:hypothetical protein